MILVCKGLMYLDFMIYIRQSTLITYHSETSSLKPIIIFPLIFIYTLCFYMPLLVSSITCLYYYSSSYSIFHRTPEHALLTKLEEEVC